jgi:alkyl hydroperoxide reductase subunit AhpC
MALKAGDPAPDFSLPAVAGERQFEFRLGDYLGKQCVVITFHPLDWTPTWAAQVPELNARRQEFSDLNAQVLDISTDSIPSHIAWQKKDIGMMEIPMCSDFFPHGSVTAQFGILRESPPVPGICERAVFIVNKEGRIAWAKVYPLDQMPNFKEMLSEVKKLNG